MDGARGGGRCFLTAYLFDALIPCSFSAFVGKDGQGVRHGGGSARGQNDEADEAVAVPVPRRRPPINVGRSATAGKRGGMATN